MFVDYYALLEISPIATSDEIKSAFKKQALRWHPDRNPGMDTTSQMQLLNEAKLILLDEEARGKYDLQYHRFKQHQREKEYTDSQQHKQEKEYYKRQAGYENEYKKEQPGDKAYTYSDFSIDDEILKKWMANAKRQAVELAKQTIEDLKGMTKAGVKEGAKAMGGAFVSQIILSIIILIIIGISKSCN